MSTVAGGLVNSQQNKPINWAYVTDRINLTLTAYDLSSNKPKPQEVITYNNTPVGVVTDKSGSVYVALYHSNQVIKYASGLAHTLQIYTQADRILSPTGLAVDKDNNLYVACQGQTPSLSPTQQYQNVVLKFAANSNRPLGTFPAPPEFAVTGIAVDNSYKVFMSAGHGQGGYIFEYSGDANNPIIVCITASQGGIAFLPNKQLVVGSSTETFNVLPPSPKQLSREFFGIGHEIRTFTSNYLGDLTLPIECNPPTSSYVIYQPYNAKQTPIKITNGINTPLGAASGP